MEIVEYTLYYPMCRADKNGMPTNFTEDDSNELKEDINFLSWEFGGSTTVKGMGNWVEDTTGILLKESIMLITLLGHPEQEIFLRGFCEELKGKKNQVSVMYTKRTVNVEFIK